MNRRVILSAAAALALILGATFWSMNSSARQGKGGPELTMDQTLDLLAQADPYEYGMDLGLPEDQMEPGPDMGPPPVANRGMGPGMMRHSDRREMRMMRKQAALERIKTEDPARYERIIKIKELAEKYRESTNDKEKAAIEKELRPLVDLELKVWQKEAEQKIAELEKKLEEQKKMLKQREQNWDEVVDHAVKKVTGQLDYLQFGPRPF